MSFLTVRQSDPRFKSLLWGHAENGKIARSLESAEINSVHEQVHFEIIDRVHVSIGTLVRHTFKWGSLVWSLAPLLLILIKNSIAHADLNVGFVLLNIGAVALLHLGLGLLSDVRDHIRGLDRVVPRSNHMALRSGWLTARQLNLIAWGLISVGTLLGLPSLLAKPDLLLVLSPLVALILLGFFLGTNGLKYRAWSEWVVFLMFGPLLTVGYQISIGGGWDLQALALGLLTGWLAVLEVHYKNFASVMINQKAGLQNTISRLGFDYGKRFLIAVAWSYLALDLAYEFFYGLPIWLLISALVMGFLLYKFSVFLTNLRSSVGSESRKVQNLGHRLNLVALTLLILQSIVLLAMDLIGNS